MSNEIIVIGAQGNSIAVLANDLFKDIDFSGISTAIEKIGDSNGNLDAESKEMAHGIVDQWQKDVVDRLRTRGHEMSNFVSFFEVGSDGRIRNAELLDEIGEDLAKKTNTTKEYEALTQLLEELQDLYDTRPEQPIARLDRTKKEEIEEDNTYRAEYAKYQLQVSKKQREIYLAEKEWKKLLKQNKEVADLIKKAKKYNKEVGNFTNMCHDKAQIAKLNITVADKNVRESLRELLNFSTTL